ncbi:hypothetical protein EST38_g1429 [Candolleomyces aberdarensis]|uniref:Uncharacterized protein n=1 Tax=Candolleomyces aberdarensis TaxID=2316362 RepID=A0A4Q2DVI1_9AGAR|nr:hypothetical protein EST38_g1429 [Candolleomyces aberdarensis]
MEDVPRRCPLWIRIRYRVFDCSTRHICSGQAELDRWKCHPSVAHCNTASMTLLDSVDSVIMLYSYTGFPQRSWKLIEFRPKATAAETQTDEVPSDIKEKVIPDVEEGKPKGDIDTNVVEAQDDEHIAAQSRAKMNVMSGLSIVLTVMSILLAFWYLSLFCGSILIWFNGLIVQQHIPYYNYGLDR